VKLHLEVNVDISVAEDDGYYRFSSNDPDTVRKELEILLNHSKSDLFEEITCAGSYTVKVT